MDLNAKHYAFDVDIQFNKYGSVSSNEQNGLWLCILNIHYLPLKIDFDYLCTQIKAWKNHKFGLALSNDI